MSSTLLLPHAHSFVKGPAVINTHRAEFYTVRNSFRVRQKGGVPGPPNRNPCPRHRSCRGHIPPQSAVSWWTKTDPTAFSTWVSFRPEMFSGIGALPKPATGPHVVSRGNPVAPCRLKAQGKRATRVGSPRSPEFPNYHELIEEPQHHEAAGNSLTAKGREHT